MSTQRRSRVLFVAALAAALIGAMLLPATASANTHKVDICHLRDDGTFKVHTVSESAWPAHEAHGDFRGADENCEDTLLAIAYSDLDGVEGFDPDSDDVLIAKFVDTVRDGLPSDGDKVVTHQYPKDLDASSFGTFGVQEHVLSGVDLGSDPGFLEVGSDQGEFIFQDAYGCEAYQEAGAGFSFFSDCTSGSDALSTESGSPSQPGDVLLESAAVDHDGDAPFIDVDIFFTP